MTFEVVVLLLDGRIVEMEMERVGESESESERFEL
jgi:hypothetical protein